MPSRKLALGILLGILGWVIGGCVLYAGGISGGSAYAYDNPRYCYDCHRHPYWTRAYDGCGFYNFYFVGNGYYYRPRHEGHRVYVFRKYNYGRDKEFVKYYKRHRLNAEDRVRIEREYRGIGEGERRRIEREYKRYDKKVESKKEHEGKTRK